MVVLSGTHWEGRSSDSRAVRRGDCIQVSGITPTHDNRLIGGGDAIAQLHFVIDKIEGAIQSLRGAVEGCCANVRVYS